MSERSAGATSSVNVSEELSALLQERERYETWIRQLEAKVDSTPRAVYDRVLADYKMRLKAVLDRVGGRTGELRTQIESLEARLAVVEKEHAELRDERAEAELRHQVGEYTAEQWKEISAHTDEALSRATKQRTDVAGDVARLREIHAAATGSDAGAGERGGPADDPIAAATTAPEPIGPDAEAAAGRADTEVPRPAVTVEPEVVKPPVVAEQASKTDPAVEPAAEPAVKPEVNPAVQAKPEIPVEVVKKEPVRAEASGRAVADQAISANGPSGEPTPTAAPVPTLASPESVQAPPARGTPSAGTGRRTSGFDDLAFVSSLIAPDERRPPSVPIPAAVAPSPTAPADTPPPRMERSSSAVGRPSGPETPSSFMKGVRGESVKTLKCQECGTLNYPTEWYCERCGGELAAL